VIKGGYMDGRALTVEEVNQLADLESREVLLSKLAGAMKGTMAKAAGLFAAPASQMARLAQALVDKRAEEGGAAPADSTTDSTADSGVDTDAAAGTSSDDAAPAAVES
jgi:large subunit ribosomal protein L10